MSKKVITTFCTGRTGTAYLSQVFSGNNWNKNLISNNNNTLVTHESWSEIKEPIYFFKKNGFNEETNNYAYNYFINNQNKLEKEHIYDRYFLTDHRFGLYFINMFLYKNIDFFILKINRSHEELLQSFIFKIKNKIKTLNQQDKFIADLYKYNIYHKDDSFLKNKYYSKEIKSLEDHLMWYFMAVDEEWKAYKKVLDDKKYLEIKFEELFAEKNIINISNRLNLKYYEKFINIKVN